MATGAVPALDQQPDDKKESPETSDAKPLTLRDRIIRKISEIFDHNERLGITRP
jgi:hypothetical protein